ncbi:FecCD family ABC transporter permease [Jeotgalibacillus soli]|uniref:Iron ABC transporter membrane protein n=1 Tax=Jeotgalibacillus soli TaxID=889306 RepID=A0A0C2RGE3_9BACL|nr:iron ABC transporter permease [Jeotgalibacillus soli]KIL49265.1 iron ABC transporter membrane protein [Jeotgalibacillus soli]
MKYWTFRLFQEKISFQFSRRWLVVLLSWILVLGGVFLVSLSAGSTWIPIHEVFQQLTGQIDKHAFVVETLRLPRALLAILVGAALGVAGLILQSLVRNSLASPDIIGISSGASLGAVTFLVFGTGVVSLQFLPFAAIGGGLMAALLIYLISWNKGVTPIRLVLIGIGISAVMKAGVTFMLVMSETAITTKSYIWLTGSIYGASWGDVTSMVVWLLIPLPILVILGRSLNITELGDEVSISMGVRLQVERFIFLMCSVILAGTAAAYAGGIEFVGLMAPHIARRLAGRSFQGLSIVTALIGAFLVLLADLIARTLFLPLDIPAGVFTAAIGAPFFLYLLFQNRNR